MFDDIDWSNGKYGAAIFERDADRIATYARQCKPGQWTFFVPGDEESGIRAFRANQTVSGTDQWKE